ncbi:uncharacterized protein CANTADRAFT_26722 [Suhomyces tanzawaensis NRRL Y-17324]|uniref:Uncharacterized protein n=1 Tax=Suhomyces tanzawaensis NRRL Y-17324 TaxID=984487 RepID=A0A1E4SH11_9ASCO|nr:uncharacterized protein CANTADRAFT_26722 [Suhomyces tanzawaensis NRRL Y-17324]ODV78776.1 hypothetical protein CANTADRAFT_26722 [Suhomyces tanzawaensis NRRL Y-17324]
MLGFVDSIFENDQYVNISLKLFYFGFNCQSLCEMQPGSIFVLITFSFVNGWPYLELTKQLFY